MTYQEALSFLYEQLPMYQRVGKAAYKKDLTNTIKLLDFLREPHHRFKSVHIAGTNGKGSSAHLLASVLTSSGYSTGLYTSPHLKNFTERVRIDGKEVSRHYVANFVDKIKPFIEEIRPSFFELTVALAFDYFAEQEVEIAVIETGLGGRLDSTNVILPEVSLITTIGFDHMDLLGDTLPQIAYEKAGIIKAGIPVVIANFQQEVHHVFEDKARLENAPLLLAEAQVPAKYEEKSYHVRLNLPGVLSVVNVLRTRGWNISNEALEHGIQKLDQLSGLKGRFQMLRNSPLIIADVSHNADGLKVLWNEVAGLNYLNLHLIFSTTVGKDVQELLSTLPKADYYWTQSSVPRSLAANDLRAIAREYGIEGAAFENVNDAIQQAVSNSAKEDLILVTGSTFAIAEIEGL